eukprot:m.79572 g.79572  ORF g.79572 m.79572 type:complete len:966 (-) comp14519_c0_seq1:177-3074(-)
MSHRVFLCKTRSFTDKERNYVSQRLNADNVELHELSYEEVEYTRFRKGDVAIIKPFEGGFYEALRAQQSLRLYGPHAVTGRFEMLPTNQRVYAPTLVPDGEERPLKVFIATIGGSASLAKSYREQLEIMGAQIVITASQADLTIADSHTKATEGAEIVVKPAWINFCFPRFMATDGCEVESTRGYLLERKSFQGATVYFLMSETLAGIYRSGLEAAGAVVVDKLGPEVTHMVVAKNSAARYWDELKQAWAMQVKVVDYGWANQPAAEQRQDDTYFLLNEDDFEVEEVEEDMDEDAEFTPMSTTATPAPAKHSPRRILSPRATLPHTPTLRGSVRPSSTPAHLRDTSVVTSSPAQKARAAANEAEACKSPGQSKRPYALQVLREHENNAVDKFQFVLDVTTLFLERLGDRAAKSYELRLVKDKLLQFEDMLSLSKTMAEALAKLGPDDPVHPIFTDTILQRYASAYRLVVADTDNFVRDVENVAAQHKELDKCAEEIKALRKERQNFMDVLRLPFQHMVRYGIHLEELLKHTPVTDVDHAVLTKVRQKVVDIVKQTNDLTSNTEAWHTIATLKLQIAHTAAEAIRAHDNKGKPVNQASAQDVRFFTHTSEKFNKGRIILLTNVILIVTKLKRHRGLTCTADYQYLHHIHLEDVTVRASGNPNVLVLQHLLAHAPEETDPETIKRQGNKAYREAIFKNGNADGTDRISRVYPEFDGCGMQVRFASHELATEFQAHTGSVLRNVGLPVPEHMALDLEAYETMLIDKEESIAKCKAERERQSELSRRSSRASMSSSNSGSFRVRTPRPAATNHRRRSQAFGNKGTFDSQANFAQPNLMDTSVGSLERSNSISSRRNSLMRVAGRAWKTLSRSGSRNKLKSKSRTTLDGSAARDAVFASPMSTVDTPTSRSILRSQNRSTRSSSASNRRSTAELPCKRANMSLAERSGSVGGKLQLFTAATLQQDQDTEY